MNKRVRKLFNLIFRDYFHGTDLKTIVEETTELKSLDDLFGSKTQGLIRALDKDERRELRARLQEVADLL